MSAYAPLEIIPQDKGVVFFLKVHAGAGRSRVTGVHDGALKLEITTAPEKGKANKAILKMLAKELGVKASSLEIVSGQTSSRKKVFASGLSGSKLGQIIADSLKGS